MKENERIGIKSYEEMTTNEVPERPMREVYREHIEEMIEDIKNGETQELSEFLPTINNFIDENYKTSMKTRSNYRKSFALVDAVVNGIKKVVVFDSFFKARKIMEYIKETYSAPNRTIKYKITQM